MATKLTPGTFFGETQTRLEVAGFTFAESCYRANVDIPMHAHENAFKHPANIAVGSSRAKTRPRNVASAQDHRRAWR
jgi:hypothetical protein